LARNVHFLAVVDWLVILIKHPLSVT